VVSQGSCFPAFVSKTCCSIAKRFFTQCFLLVKHNASYFNCFGEVSNDPFPFIIKQVASNKSGLLLKIDLQNAQTLQLN